MDKRGRKGVGGGWKCDWDGQQVEGGRRRKGVGSEVWRECGGEIREARDGLTLNHLTCFITPSAIVLTPKL